MAAISLGRGPSGDGRPVLTLAAYRQASELEMKVLTVWREGRETTLKTR